MRQPMQRVIDFSVNVGRHERIYRQPVRAAGHLRHGQCLPTVVTAIGIVQNWRGMMHDNRGEHVPHASLGVFLFRRRSVSVFCLWTLVS